MGSVHDLIVEFNALDYIKLFFTDELMKSIAVSTNKYVEYDMRILRHGSEFSLVYWIQSVKLIFIRFYKVRMLKVFSWFNLRFCGCSRFLCYNAKLLVIYLKF